MGKFKQRREQKKIEKNKKREKEFEQTKKEIEDVLNNLNQLMGNDDNIKMVDFKIPTKKERILSDLLKYGLSFILILSISGFIKWVYYDSIFAILGLSLSIIVVEYILWLITTHLFGKYIFYTFGSLNILPPILSFVVCSLVFPFVELVNVWLLIVVILIYIIVRKVMLSSFRKEKVHIIRGK